MALLVGLLVENAWFHSVSCAIVAKDACSRDCHADSSAPVPPYPCSTTVFSHSQTVVVCPSCNTVLCVPTGGKARLTEGA